MASIESRAGEAGTGEARTAARGNGSPAVGGSGIRKVRSGIDGLDAIAHGGLPAGRTTLLAGGAGCGKTLFALTYLIEGALRFDEPGVFVTFEEGADELVQNIASLGYDLRRLRDSGKVAVEHIQFEPRELAEAGEYDLEGLFIRIGHAIDGVKAKRVVLDTIEVLLGGLTNTALVRSELQRLFRWLKKKGVTAMITAERGQGALTRSGLEEYVSDCVILLDQRVEQEIATRRLRVVKYRGSAHGTNEYPFIIDEEGISVFPVTTLQLNQPASGERMPTGIAHLDTMLGGHGFFRGSSVLISGTSGAGKSTFCAAIAEAACKRGECAVYITFEESPDQMIRNMRSVGIDLARCQAENRVRFHAARPTLQGLDTHLAVIEREISRSSPALVVIDPITALLNIGTEIQVHAMLLRTVDLLKSRGITAMFTSLDRPGGRSNRIDGLVSSLIDTWIALSDSIEGGESNRTLFIRKSRGMAHSNQIREFLMTKDGIHLREPYLGPRGALMGSARLAQEAKDAAAALARQQEIEKRRRELERKRTELEHQVAALQRQFRADEEALETMIREDQARARQVETDRDRMGTSRRSDTPSSGNGKPLHG